MDDKRNNAAKVIQRSIRKYQRKLNEVKDNSDIKNSPSKSISKIVENSNKTYNSARLTEIQIEINGTLANLNEFYKNMPANQERIKHQDFLMGDIHKSLQNLRKIAKLEDCEDLKFESFSEDARSRHEAMLNEQSEKWWENLNKN